MRGGCVMRCTVQAEGCARVAGAVAAVFVLMLTAGCGVRKPILVVNKSAQSALDAWVGAVRGGPNTGRPENPLRTETDRNIAISYSEAAVMARYAAVRQNLLNGRAATKVLFDVVGLGLTAAVPISNGARGKTILGSLATGFKGSDLSIDRNVFNEQSTAAILSAMDTCVSRQRAVIAERRKRGVDQYTIYDGYADLTRLYGCTTLAGALQELGENQAIAARHEQLKIAPITAEQVKQLTELSAAYAKDKKFAVEFLKQMNVSGLTENSTDQEFRAAFRALSSVLTQPEDVERLLEAGRKAKQITTQPE
jgi:hypothetical protein